MQASSATLAGLLAIGLWSTLALLTAATGAVPPFLLTALTFAVGGGVGLGFVLARPAGLTVLAQPWRVWLHGVGGLFGFHACYFFALKLAPPAEAGLIAYLWPLLIVLFAALLPGERLLPRHVAGALLGLAGTAVLLGGGFELSAAYLPGYAAALACALIWAIYSVAARLFAQVPTEAVAGFCLATAALSALVHLSTEPTAEEIAEKAMLGAEVVRRFGLEPKVALLSHANFGSRESQSSAKMRAALAILHERAPDLEADGEMNADLALSRDLRERVLPASRLGGEANLLVMPDLDSAKISAQLVAAIEDALPVGPILIGAARAAQIVTSTTTARGLVNVTALAVLQANSPLV
jgi:hypothetical protein